MAAVTLLAVGSVIFSAPVWARAAQSQQEIDIPAGPLGNAIAQLGRKMGVMIVFDPVSVRGRRTVGLRGAYAPAQALARLLSGSGMEARPDGRGGFTLVAVPRPAQRRVVVQSPSPERRTEPAGVTPVPEIIVNGDRAITATKTDTPLVETPQAISVVPSALFTARNALNLQETLRYSAGVTAEPFGFETRYDSSLVRGLNPVSFVDGLRNVFSTTPLARTAVDTIERVEVLRGPASVLYGQASNGGIINSISKRPQFTPSGLARVEYGSFDRKQALVDITGPLEDSGVLAGRLIGIVRDSGQQTDILPDDRVVISPSLTWRPGPDTEITALALYQRDRSGANQQFLPLAATLLAASPSRRIDNSTFLGDANYDRLIQRTLAFTVTGSHRFSEAASLNGAVRYADARSSLQRIYPNSFSNPLNPFIDGDANTGRSVGRYAYQIRPHVNILTSDFNFQLRFETGPFEHLVLAGIDYTDYRQRSESGFSVTTPIDIYDPVSTGVVAPSYSRNPNQRNTQLGAYFQDQIRYADRVTLVVGARHDRARSRTQGSAGQTDSVWTFKAGLIGDVGAGISPYASYSEAFQPVVGLNVYNIAFVPTRGRQYEAGIKWQATRHIGFTAAYYDIVEQNRLVLDPDNINNNIQTGEIASRGFEFEATAIIPNNVTLTAAFSHNAAKVTKSTVAAEVGQRLSEAPRDQASLWVEKTIQSSDAGKFRLGAGVRYVGASVSTSSSLTVRTPDYTLVDAIAAVDWRRWTFTINASNLLGTDYYANCRAFGDCFTGVGRNVIGSITYHF